MFPLLLFISVLAAGVAASSSLIKSISHEPDSQLFTTYIFGPKDEFDSLRLSFGESSGFIELSFDGSMLAIELVRRPLDWPKDWPFCSIFLPAVVSNFITNKIKVPIEQIQRVSVTNLADNPLVGCRCYVGLLHHMGVETLSGGREIGNDPKSLCEADPMTQRTIAGKPVRIPSSTNIAGLIVNLARTYARLEY